MNSSAFSSLSDPVTRMTGRVGNRSLTSSSAAELPNPGRPWSDRMMSGTHSRSACSKRARVSTRWLRERNPHLLTRRSSSGATGAAASLQSAVPSQRPAAVLCQPLLADPKEPRFFATYLWTRSSRLASRLGSVGLGQTIGLLRGRDWQLGIGAAVFSEFNMQSSTTDLLNTDYLVGLPLTYQHGSLTTRLRLFHQSSHLGDEYMAHTNARRIDLTFQAVELLVARETTRWRLYGGGDYIFAHSPTDLKPGVLHGGLEFRQPASLLRLGRGAAGRFVAGLGGEAVRTEKRR